MKPFEVTQSCYGTQCVEGVDIPIDAMREIKMIVMNNKAGVEYNLRSNAGAFLQWCYETNTGVGYIKVDFWQDDYLPLVNYINEKLRKLGFI